MAWAIIRQPLTLEARVQCLAIPYELPWYTIFSEKYGYFSYQYNSTNALYIFIQHRRFVIVNIESVVNKIPSISFVDSTHVILDLKT
jgi:uncharacterized membrane protein YcgQ (UPF0703/DUF1980 family)